MPNELEDDLMQEKPHKSIQEIWGWAGDTPPEAPDEVTGLEVEQDGESSADPTPVTVDPILNGDPHLDEISEELDEDFPLEEEIEEETEEEEEEIDFWQGLDPDRVESFKAETGQQPGEMEEEYYEEDDFFSGVDRPAGPATNGDPGLPVALEDLQVIAAPLPAAPASADEIPTRIVEAVRPRVVRKPEDYQVPVIPWLSLKKRGAKVWGYGFIIAILVTIFGSISIGTYLVLLNSKVSIPTVVVNVSIVSLLFFLLVLVLRYVALIYMSFLHLHRSKEEEFDEINQQLKASILIPAYNESKGIEESIKSMLEMDYDNFEVIVINDGSKDDTLEVARALEGWHGNVLVRVISQKNMGKANALNYGASVATGDVIVCVDGDSKLHPDTLKLGMRHFSDPKLGSVAGNVKVINRRNMVTNLQALEYIEGLNLVRRAQALMQAVNIVPGPCGFFRRTTILDVGGWDDDTYAEDCDLTLKVLTKGWKIDYEPGAISYTEAPEKMLILLKQRYRWTRGILQSMRKHAIHLINPLAGWRVVLVMWQMVFESVLWPLMNVVANLLFLLVAMIFGMSPLIVFWWVQLTILDTLAAMHTIAIERESMKLVPFAILYRAFFIQFVDIAKLIATVEELMGMEMSWGHIERTGRLTGHTTGAAVRTDRLQQGKTEH